MFTKLLAFLKRTFLAISGAIIGLFALIGMIIFVSYVTFIAIGVSALVFVSRFFDRCIENVTIAAAM